MQALLHTHELVHLHPLRQRNGGLLACVGWRCHGGGASEFGYPAWMTPTFAPWVLWGLRGDWNVPYPHMLLASWLVWLGRHQRDEGWQWVLSTLSPWRGTDCWKIEDGMWGWWCGRLPDFRIGKAGGRYSKTWLWDPSQNVGEAILALTRAKDSKGRDFLRDGA